MKPESLKKWKGKDWFSILAPKTFGESFLAETPATDSKYLAGRTIQVPASFLTGDKTKNHMKLIFKVNGVDGKKAYTQFGGFFVNREFIGRNIRAETEKLQVIDYAETKDNWKLQLTTIAIINGKCESTIGKKSRKIISEFFKKAAAEATMDDFLKNIISGNYQRIIRKDCSKVYPLRFAEISKVEVIKTGDIAA